MPRQSGPRRDAAFEVWKAIGDERKRKDIAAQLSVSRCTSPKVEWEHLKYFNATKAYGCSYKTANVEGRRNLVANII